MGELEVAGGGSEVAQAAVELEVAQSESVDVVLVVSTLNVEIFPPSL